MMDDASPQAERLVPMRELLERVPVHRTTIYDWVRAGTFPKPRKAGSRTMWLESELVAWMRQTEPEEV